MAIEGIRGCGYRKVNGLYLCGEFISSPCDRMPFPLTTCPVCGQGIKVSRGFTQVNPFRLWGNHDGVLRWQRDATGNYDLPLCQDKFRPCHLCDPQDQPAYIMLVGAGNYKTPFEFLDEAQRMGISKRIPFIPKDLELGKTVIYLAHPRACEVREPVAMQQAMAIVEGAQTDQPRLLETEKVGKALGIFTAFIPQRVEKLIWESEATPEELERLEKRGIKAIVIPNEDKDHS